MQGAIHPNEPWNYRGSDEKMPDPVIQEENAARECLRIQGITINDRVNTYYG